MRSPCENCPWRVSNHGKRTPWGFYTKTNLRRLWNQIRKGGAPQSCHPTDPNHPDHIAAGAKPASMPLECPGSVIVVYREFEKLKQCSDNPDLIDGIAVGRYLAKHKDGLTKSGILYWLVSRHTFGGKPFIGGPILPEVNLDEPGVNRD